MWPRCHAGATRALLLAAASEQMSREGVCFCFLFLCFEGKKNFFEALHDLVPEIPCAKIKIFGGSKKQETSKEIELVLVWTVQVKNREEMSEEAGLLYWNLRS